MGPIPDRTRTDLPYLRRRVKPGAPATGTPARLDLTRLPGSTAPVSPAGPPASDASRASTSAAPRPTSGPQASSGPQPSSASQASSASQSTARPVAPPASAPPPIAAPAAPAPPVAAPDPAQPARPTATGPVPPAGRSGTGLDLGPRRGAAPTGAAGRSHATAPGGTATPSATSASGVAGAPARPHRAPAEQLPPFPAPTIGEVLVLGDEEPMVRLDPRRSAIGTLLVHGAVVAVWEATTLETGWCTASGERAGRTVHTPGNRELVGLGEEGGLIALRHLSMLRRAVFVGDTEPLEVDLFDGSHTIVSTGDASTMNVLSIVRVGPRLELRAEPLTRPITLDEVVRRFGFVVTGGASRRERRNG